MEIQGTNKQSINCPTKAHVMGVLKSIDIVIKQVNQSDQFLTQQQVKSEIKLSINVISGSNSHSI
jgi:hypothetical protein